MAGTAGRRPALPLPGTRSMAIAIMAAAASRPDTVAPASAASRQSVPDPHLFDDDEFACPHFAKCRASRLPGNSFREGIMSHMGHRFHHILDGRPRTD